MAAKKPSTGPEGNPLDAKASIPDDTGVPGETPVNAAPNDDESAQQTTQDPHSSGLDGPVSIQNEGVEPGTYIATDGDVQGQGTSTADLRDRRVVDANAPFDYAELPDDSTVQGNVYPPGADFYAAEIARAEQSVRDAEYAAEVAKDELQAAKDAQKDGELLIPDQGTSITEGTNPLSDEAVRENKVV